MCVFIVSHKSLKSTSLTGPFHPHIGRNSRWVFKKLFKFHFKSRDLTQTTHYTILYLFVHMSY